METILLYLIKATVCLVAFALFFRLLLMRETFFRFMRITLLSGMLICSVLPLVKLKIGKSNPFSEQIVLLNEKILTAQIQPNHNIPIVSAAEIGGFSNVPTSETEIEPTNQTAKPFPWLSVLSAIYLAGFAAMIARFALSFIRLRQLISKSRVTQYGKYRLVISEEEVVPFSFFRYIVLSEKDYTENPDEIILHEKMHIRKGHNIDVILSEILLAVL